VAWGLLALLVGIAAGTVVLSWRASRLRATTPRRAADEQQDSQRRAA
jgi:hypothetical protein